VSADELATDAVKKQLLDFDAMIKEKLGEQPEDEDEPDLIPQIAMSDVDDDDSDVEYEAMDPDFVPNDADDYDEEAFDKLLAAEVMVPKGDALVAATVIGRKRDADGNPVGKAHNNPILDTRVYEVQFPDGHLEEYAANVIAESLYSQLDNEGNQFLLLQEIVDHKKDAQALSKDDMWIQGTGGSGNRHMKKTTKGWKLCVT
jgi:hypothetical protein